MDTMNKIERIKTQHPEYRPILRPRVTELRADSQRSECTCPDLCPLDHDN